MGESVATFGRELTSHESGTPIYDLANHAWGYHEDSKKDATFLLAFILLIVVSLALSWVLEHRFKCKILPEACVVLTVGMAAGFLCKALFVRRGKRGFFSGALLGFDNALFFLGLLPPVIFYSGYELHPQWLFGLFYQIVGFAVVGTFVSAVIVGIILKVASLMHLAPQGITFAETLTFGALVSATDPVSVIGVFTELRVDPKMFYLVFGESVINDAVGIVLFKTFSKFVGYSFNAKNLGLAIADFIVIFLGSAIVGGVCAACTAVTLRLLRADGWSGSVATDEGAAATSRTLQLVTLACSVWAPTFLAELIEMSGIVATLFAAIGVRHWATPNLQSSLTVDAKPVATAVLSTLAHLADTIIFLYLGLSVPAKTRDWTNDYSHSLTFWAIVACLAGRAAHVYPLSHYMNKSLRKAQSRQSSSMDPLADGDTLGDPIDGEGKREDRRSLSPRASTEVGNAGEIPPAMQHMLWFSGLRGAVAFSCAHTFPNAHGHRTLFATTTIVLIIVSMYVLGALTVPVLKALGISRNCVLADDGSPMPPPLDSPVLRLRRSASMSTGVPNAPLPLRMLQGLDRHLYPLLVRRTPPSSSSEPDLRPTELEMVEDLDEPAVSKTML